MILLQRFSKTVLKNIELLSKKMCFSPKVWFQKISIQDSLICTPPPPTPQDFLFHGVFEDPLPPGISRIFKRGLPNPLGKYLYLRNG